MSNTNGSYATAQTKNGNGRHSTPPGAEKELVQKLPRQRDAFGREQATRAGRENSLSAMEQERLRRERRIQDLLPDEEEAQEKTYDSRLVKRLMVYVGVYRREFIVSVILIVVSSLMSVGTPWMIQRAIDEGIRAGNVGTLRFWTFLFLAAIALEWITSRARLTVMAYAGTRIVTDLRSQLFRHLHTLSLGLFQRL